MCGNAAFVFCLHRLTPEDVFEHQPLLLGNALVMLFDGRIDNRSELSEALGITASELHSMPDSMMALRLFDRWGERAFERIVGDFAIIVMDPRDGQLICARDHMGLRVLHYHRSAKRFAVATSPDALFALGWVPRILNKDKVGDTLVHRGLDGETTYYQEIFRVLPGCIVGVRDGKFSKDRFWDPQTIADVRFKSDHDYVEALQERLDAAVKAQLRSNRVPCATITGGLDSSTIAVIAADMLAANGNRLNTFTAVPEAGFTLEDRDGMYFDETPYVRRIAEGNPNITPHFIPPSKGPFLEQIAQEIRMGGFSGGVLNGLWVLDILDAARSAGHNVMLSGDMGNFTISNDGRSLLTELVLRGRWFRLFRELRSSGDRWKVRMRVYVIGPFVPARLYRSYKNWRRGGKPPWYSYSAIHPDFAATSGILNRAAQEDTPFDAPPPRDGRWARIKDFDSYCESADWLANLRAAFGVDFRMPAFDRRVVEFCVGIPQEQNLRKGRERWLIKRTMKGRLPDVVLYNKKRGAQAADWYPRMIRERHRIAAELKRLAVNDNVASIVDLERLIAEVNNWPDRQPRRFSPQQLSLQEALPQALGAAYFIENATGANHCRASSK
jgi:asparagine synthase (glutamine-hydrolysing)